MSVIGLARSRSDPHIGESLDIASRWVTAADLIFLDADHRLEAIRADIAAWTPHVRAGGILCGHDYSPVWPAVVRAVDESGPCEHAASVWWRKIGDSGAAFA